MQQHGKTRESILMVRLQQRWLCFGDFCAVRETSQRSTTSNADAYKKCQPVESDAGRRITSLAAKLLREIVAHLGKKGVIKFGHLEAIENFPDTTEWR